VGSPRNAARLIPKPLIGLARRTVGAALSVGPGYERQPPGSRFDPVSVAGYYLDYSAKTSAMVDPTRLVPADLAQLALGWWERHLAGEPAAASSFLEVCRLLETRSTQTEAGAWWPYGVVVQKYGLRPPWYSAMAQGQIASVFTRALVLTGDERHGTLAEAAARTLLPPSPLVSTSSAGPILEEAPSAPPSHILNGWIFALWGLRDLSIALGESAAAGLYRQSLSALQLTLPRYDVGWWSRYSLYPHPLTDLAKPFYHRLHADQLEVLGRAENLPDFIDRARRWRQYDSTPRRVGAIAHKAAFAAVDFWHRRGR
jgi:heparosan-N-sulfate-glucuronate 5-epimerase